MRIASRLDGPDWEHIGWMRHPITGHVGVLVRHAPSRRIGLALNGGISKLPAETEAA